MMCGKQSGPREGRVLAPAWLSLERREWSYLPHRLLLTPFPSREGKAGAPRRQRAQLLLLWSVFSAEEKPATWVRDVWDIAMASPVVVSAKVEEEREQVRETVGREQRQVP